MDLQEKLDRLEINYDYLKEEKEKLKKENKKLKETIKDHQLYEEKLEHRIIELEEFIESSQTFII